ncbi:SAM-dependent methyltransferase [Acidiplasma aeolicum]|uniref:SAM-dependent methyltransferase n=2 Tax=Acidiplasma TaxID=507753 RepID=A0A0Q0WJ38_9ARCH|nr:class I SAM-dependent methyltransferase [Acidiplasma aeolicum]KPV46043.1 SAM-dependent methyltransferase [Acidiplasma aeolicum]KQB35669.1 SAM-dependent methyltransferase [Acidiplasma aeolicum]
MEEKIDYFNRHYMDYDKWYDIHIKEYSDQINFIRSVIPDGNGIEIGVGTGRFASALNIKYGIDVSESMVSLAKTRGINALVASAYSIPYPDKYFDFSLNMVTICFLDFPEKAIVEAKRISNECITVILDKNCEYINNIIKNPAGFYRYAKFYSFEEIMNIYKSTGFKDIKYKIQDFYTDNNVKYRLVAVSGR